MMIAVTGASGKLGSLVVDGLLKSVLADRIVAIVRTPKRPGDSPRQVFRCDAAIIPPGDARSGARGS